MFAASGNQAACGRIRKQLSLWCSRATLHRPISNCCLRTAHGPPRLLRRVHRSELERNDGANVVRREALESNRLEHCPLQVGQELLFRRTSMTALTRFQP